MAGGEEQEPGRGPSVASWAEKRGRSSWVASFKIERVRHESLELMLVD